MTCSENKEKKTRRKKRYIQPVELIRKVGNKTTNNIDSYFEVNNLYYEDLEKDAKR